MYGHPQAAALVDLLARRAGGAAKGASSAARLRLVDDSDP